MTGRFSIFALVWLMFVSWCWAAPAAHCQSTNVPPDLRGERLQGPQTAAALLPAPAANTLREVFLGSKRVVFVGDSITYDGEFLVWLEAALIDAGYKTIPEILNLGLPSETCCGLSEPSHPFPRPNVHDRIERLLNRLAPDLIVVNYGMNDGIYHPFSDQRFTAYQNGIGNLIDSAKKRGVKIVLVTPTPFDPLPLRKKGSLLGADSRGFDWRRVYEKYDTEVLGVYSHWLVQQKSRVAGVVDVRGPMLKYYRKKRMADPNFVMSNDGVHINDQGQRVLGNALVAAMGVRATENLEADVLEAIRQRNRLLRDAWVKHVDHAHPQVVGGLPLDQALMRAEKVNLRLAEMVENSTHPEKP